MKMILWCVKNLLYGYFNPLSEKVHEHWRPPMLLCPRPLRPPDWELFVHFGLVKFCDKCKTFTNLSPYYLEYDEDGFRWSLSSTSLLSPECCFRCDDKKEEKEIRRNPDIRRSCLRWSDIVYGSSNVLSLDNLIFRREEWMGVA